MLGDMVPIIHRFPDRRDITIYPIFDLHIGAAEWMEAEWTAAKKRILDDPNAYIVIGGDMINNGIKSSVTNVYAETMRPREQKALLAKELEPFKDKILCLTGGNHEQRSAREVDDNPLYDVACKLDIEHLYRENGCFLILRFGNQKGDGNKNPTYMLAVLHGAGGGMYIGSSANRQERYGAIIDGLDVLITGHVHKLLVYPSAKLAFDPQNKKIGIRQFHAVTATSWLGYSDYAMRKMLIPTAHRVSVITLCGKRKDVRVTI